MIISKMIDLQLGDVVSNNRPGEAETPNNQMTVIKKTDKTITFFRPYVHLSEFEHVGGVTPYVGIEQFETPINDTSYTVLGNIYNPRAELK